MNQPELITDSHWETRFWFMTTFFLVIRLILAVFLDLSPDEAYYWEFSRRLDFSYFDHPPMVAYVIWVSRLILGDSPFAVRLPALLSFFIVSRIVFILGKFLDNSCKTGFFASFLLQITPASLALGFVITPDSPLALFWSLAAWAFLHCLSQKNSIWWALLGVFLGAGAMSKYNMIFFCPGVAAVILGFSRYASVLYTRRFWIMVILAFLGTFPILYWNLQHDWISFRFQFKHGLTRASRPVWLNTGEFLGGQLGTIGLTLFPVLCWQMLVSLSRALKEKDATRFALAAIAFPMLAFFTFSGIRSKVESNWPQMAYLTLLPLVAEWLVQKQKNLTFYVVCIPSIILTTFAVIQAFTLIFPIPPRSDITTRLHGWSAMGKAIQEIDHRTHQKAIFIGQGAPLAALVSYYGRLPVERIAEVNGKGNWKFWWKNQDNRFIEPPAGSDAIFVDNNRNSEVKTLAQYFQQTIGSESFSYTKNDRFIRVLNFTHFHNYLGGLKFDLASEN